MKTKLNIRKTYSNDKHDFYVISGKFYTSYAVVDAGSKKPSCGSQSPSVSLQERFIKPTEENVHKYFNTHLVEDVKSSKSVVNATAKLLASADLT